MVSAQEIIGLLPAGGRGARLSPLPCSKELFPIGFGKADDVDGMRPKAVAHYLLEKMRSAGVRKAYVILRQGKWDIPSYFGDGTMVSMDLAYLMMRVPFGTPYTLDQAYPFVRHSVVAFGFPDILFDGQDAYKKLLDRQASTGADAVLGLFPVEQPWTMDMAGVDEHGAVRSITIKPMDTVLQYGWVIAVWTPVFTEFLHEHILSVRRHGEQDLPTNSAGEPELSVGHVFQAALGNGLRIQSVQFAGGSYLDIGTPGNLAKAVYDQKFFAAARS